MSSSSWKLRPPSEGPRPSEASRTVSVCLTRVRRPRRVLYPAFRTRRAPPTEAPDHALRWLLLLSALVLLQIYNEETHTCTELQVGPPEPSCSSAPPKEDSLDAAAGREGAEPRRVLTLVGGAYEQQTQCVVL